MVVAGVEVSPELLSRQSPRPSLNSKYVQCWNNNNIVIHNSKHNSLYINETTPILNISKKFQALHEVLLMLVDNAMVDWCRLDTSSVRMKNNDSLARRHAVVLLLRNPPMHVHTMATARRYVCSLQWCTLRREGIFNGNSTYS